VGVKANVGKDALLLLKTYADVAIALAQREALRLTVADGCLR
jgi:hypothetical protein